MATGLKVLASGFEYSDSERGITATVRYIYDQADTVGNETLPNIGDLYSTPSWLVGGGVPGFRPEYLYLRCKQRTFTTFGDTIDKGVWTCVYNNEPTDQYIYNNGPTTDPKLLPYSLEFSGEYVNIEPPTEGNDWVWRGNEEPVDSPLAFRVPNISLRIWRYLPENNMDSWSAVCKNRIGKVNAGGGEFPVGGGAGCWLFSSVTTEPFNYNLEVATGGHAENWHRVDMIFLFRDPDGTDYDGWQKLLRPKDGVWDTPVSGPSLTKLYQYGNFLSLFQY